MMDIEYNNPFDWLDAWLVEAEAAEINDPTAMALATVAADGTPSVRIVLMKGRDDEGVHFYTNRMSRKAVEIEASGTAALCFHWKSLRRQIRMVGRVTALSDAVSDAYYATRPYGSKIGAWASKQSAPLDSRATLEARIAELEKQYPENSPPENPPRPPSPPRPVFWGGYRLTPHEIEFWQDGAFRLHDRFRFTLDAGLWSAQRLYP